MKEEILITGVSGFIGFNLAKALILQNKSVIGIDNMNSYYDPSLKKARLDQLRKCSNNENFKFYKTDLIHKSQLNDIFKATKPKVVINLAAQAGVRYSLENPNEYINSNVLGFMNILEASKDIKVENLIYASSSSVYGGNKVLPFSENHNVDHPVSIYAATKKANELMAHTYSHLFNIPTIGLRFFTVYGPWGRPDMALFLFTKAIIEGKPIQVFNNGNMSRDFTYIDDIVKSIIKLIYKPACSVGNSSLNKDPSTSWAPYRIFNIGNSKPTSLMKYIEAIENELSIKAICNFMDLQPGDVQNTFADTSLLKDWIDYRPTTKVEDGIKSFVKWYRNYYKV